MRPGWKKRALTWLFLAESVRANYRRYPGLPTAWLPHGVGNSFLLWMPELLQAADAAFGLEERCRSDRTVSALFDAVRELCVDNPRWVLYVAPAALGYAISHPRFNIYKGDLAALRLFGFGLDAIPHSVTAFAVSHFFQDGLTILGRHLPRESVVSRLLCPLARHPSLSSLALLALISVVWEAGEYIMQQEELRRTGGDRAAINMEWTFQDMVFDLISNALGWLVADWQQRERRSWYGGARSAGCSQVAV